MSICGINHIDIRPRQCATVFLLEDLMPNKVAITGVK